MEKYSRHLVGLLFSLLGCSARLSTTKTHLLRRHAHAHGLLHLHVLLGLETLHFLISVLHVLLTHHVVSATKCIIIFIQHLSLFFILYVAFHFTIVNFAHGLGLAVVSFLGHVGALLDTILSHHTEVSFGFELLSITTHFLHLSDHSYVFSAIKTSVSNLSLEGQVGDLSEVEIVHLN